MVVVEAEVEVEDEEQVGGSVPMDNSSLCSTLLFTENKLELSDNLLRMLIAVIGALSVTTAKLARAKSGCTSKIRTLVILVQNWCCNASSCQVSHNSGRPGEDPDTGPAGLI